MNAMRAGRRPDAARAAEVRAAREFPTLKAAREAVEASGRRFSVVSYGRRGRSWVVTGGGPGRNAVTLMDDGSWA